MCGDGGGGGRGTGQGGLQLQTAEGYRVELEHKGAGSRTWMALWVPLSQRQRLPWAHRQVCSPWCNPAARLSKAGSSRQPTWKRFALVAISLGSLVPAARSGAAAGTVDAQAREAPSSRPGAWQRQTWPESSLAVQPPPRSCMARMTTQHASKGAHFHCTLTHEGDVHGVVALAQQVAVPHVRLRPLHRAQRGQVRRELGLDAVDEGHGDVGGVVHNLVGRRVRLGGVGCRDADITAKGNEGAQEGSAAAAAGSGRGCSREASLDAAWRRIVAQWSLASRLASWCNTHLVHMLCQQDAIHEVLPGGAAARGARVIRW